MPSYDNSTIIGHLGRDPEIRHLAGGTAVCEVSVAVSRSWKDKSTGERREKVCWIPVTFWGRTAEVLAEYCRKGDAILVRGYHEMDEWQDKESGQKRTKLKLVADQLVMLGGRNPDDQSPRSDHGEESQEPAAQNPDEVPF